MGRKGSAEFAFCIWLLCMLLLGLLLVLGSIETSYEFGPGEYDQVASDVHVALQNEHQGMTVDELATVTGYPEGSIETVADVMVKIGDARWSYDDLSERKLELNNELAPYSYHPGGENPR